MRSCVFVCELCVVLSKNKSMRMGTIILHNVQNSGAMKQFMFKTKTCSCKAWNSFTNTKFKKNTGLCEPGQVCNSGCKIEDVPLRSHTCKRARTKKR